ncbi:3-isopropylmalate dehydratase large subunit [Sporomusa sp.]|uniref:3-isopropylmalate dehydratase large subunit n=1 Tax=Sporomusa sp. TaxID=2078658 RepID=UPI002C64101E|nr:3-isopropylmalate dehydratase large subunit [Sporomusa sp.]HWR06567.1 3-isopropylmalate dehydratase large subunit [Sporomusa sp.]
MGINTLFDNLWDMHVVEKIDDNNYLIAVDRCFLHDLSGPYALEMLSESGLRAYNSGSVIATPDHTLSSKPGRTVKDSPISMMLMPRFEAGCRSNGIRLFGLDDERQGIVHVVGPELGLSLPGMTIVCGDSHTCTHGAMGSLSWGVGTTELYHVLATQTLTVKKPKTLRINLTGDLAQDVGPMDIILFIISKLGTDFGIGYAIEYSGSAVSAMHMEQRMTLCNLTVELGSEYGMISPDEKTLRYIEGKEFAPKGEDMEALAKHCQEIASGASSVFDKEISFDVSEIRRQISWGITPAHTVAVDGVVPVTDQNTSEKDRRSFTEARKYMGLEEGQKIEGVPINRVFIGSCSNGRISNIEQVAEMVKGQKVADSVEAWVVPGSQKVKQAAENLGLHKIIQEAGFLWGEPSCSLCGGCNGEKVQPGHRCVSTTNRNFIGRQGPNARTHLASPYTAALAAINGKIV